MPKNANRALPVAFCRFKTPLRKRAQKSNFFKGKSSFKICLKRKRNRKETKRSRKKDENRKKSRNNEYSLSCMQLRQSEMKTSKSVGGIMCSGRTFPFRFLAEYGRL